MEFKTKEEAVEYFNDVNLLKPVEVFNTAIEEIQYNLKYTYYIGLLAGINLITGFDLFIDRDGKIKY